MGGGVEMQTAEAAERNWSVSLHRVKTWPQLMCCALVLEPGVFIGRRKEGDEESSRGIIFRGIYIDYKLRNIYKVSSPFILQEKGLVWSSNKD